MGLLKALDIDEEVKRLLIETEGEISFRLPPTPWEIVVGYQASKPLCWRAVVYYHDKAKKNLVFQGEYKDMEEALKQAFDTLQEVAR